MVAECVKRVFERTCRLKQGDVTGMALAGLSLLLSLTRPMRVSMGVYSVDASVVYRYC
jgi:hypothetical protein